MSSYPPLEALDALANRVLSTRALTIDILEALESLTNVQSGADVALAGTWFLGRASGHPEVSRSVAFLLATHSYQDSDLWLGILLDYLWSPPESSSGSCDPALLINLATAVRQAAPLVDPPALNALGLAIPTFIKACLKSVPLVAEAGVNLLVDLDEQDLATGILGPLERKAIEALAYPQTSPADSTTHASDFVAFQGSLARRRLRANHEFDLSPAVRFRSGLRRLREQAEVQGYRWSKHIAAHEMAYDRHFREWTLRADVRKASTQVHQLRLVAADGGGPPFEVVSRLVEGWQRFVRTFSSKAESLSFRPLATMEGSFVLDLAVQDSPPELLNQLLLEGSAESMPAWQEQSEWVELNDLATREQVHLECEVVDPNHPSTRWRVMIEPERPVHRGKVGKRTLRSIDIPQADNLERVFQVVELVHKGQEPSSKNLKIEPRQVDYYVWAAKILHLLTEDSRLDVAGERLVGLEPGYQLALGAMLFEASRCGAAWTSWAKARTLADVDPTTAKDFLADTVSTLNAVTAARRSKTLVAWHERLMPWHYTRRHPNEIALNPEEQSALWTGLNEQVELTPGQLRLAELLRGKR